MTYATQARTLDDIAADSHVFSIIAMDQRNTLRRMFTAVGLDATDDDLRVAKADVARVLTPAASGLLSDPTYGVPAITEAKALAPDCGLLVAAEPSERRSLPGRAAYPPRPGSRRALGAGPGRRRPQVLRAAARRPPGPRRAPASRTWSPRRSTVARGHRRLPRDRRPVGHREPRLPAARGGLNGQAREDAIIEAARALDELDIDLLKLEYPGSPEGCRRLAAILHRPWAVLSAGVPFDQFTDILGIAAEDGGASGFIAGRSVWREVVGLAGPHREEFLTTVALPRLERLIEVAEHRARPWTEATRPSAL